MKTLHEIIANIPESMRSAVARLAGCTENELAWALEETVSVDRAQTLEQPCAASLFQDYKEAKDAIESILRLLGWEKPWCSVRDASALAADWLAAKWVHRDTLEERAREAAKYRDHSITLHQVYHVLTRHDGPVPMEPWPLEEDENTVFEKAYATSKAVAIAVDALVPVAGRATSNNPTPVLPYGWRRLSDDRYGPRLQGPDEERIELDGGDRVFLKDGAGYRVAFKVAILRAFLALLDSGGDHG